MIRHHRRPVAGAVGAENVFERGVPLVPGEVEISVGRIFAPGVEKPLEHQPLLQRVDVRESQTVADDRVGDAAPAAVGRGIVHDVVDDEEVLGESFGRDDRQLVVDSVANDW